MAGDVKGNRVGGSIDMSVDLANASHFDSNDASQGFSVWTEEMPGVADNWYFVMPNLHGVSVDGRAFEGVAIKLRHGTAISWDGRLIRHCTSLSRPDGGNQCCGFRKGSLNHLYGTFTCAKERLVNAGRRRAKMMQEMEEFAYTDEERSRILGDEKEPSDEDEIFAPTIKDADPDDGPVPKMDARRHGWDGIGDERCLRNETMHANGLQTSTSRNPALMEKLQQGRSRKLGSNLVVHVIFYVCSFVEV
ncbi:hypothetical protein MHU86_13668 [Fragilaria crotonensis]|nr:hypothetical protein MHU86_13668 [Fragilaria crotonensis]